MTAALFSLDINELRENQLLRSGFLIAEGFRASKTHLCKTEVQFSKQSLVLIPRHCNPPKRWVKFKKL